MPLNETELSPDKGDRQSQFWDLIIVGAGLAGIAAALEARRLKPDWKILVIESRRRLGGRAGSFADPRTGHWVDNCQHVGLGCCHELQKFVRILGFPEAFRRVETLEFLTPDGRVDQIKATSFLPRPFHLIPSFLKLKFLGLWDKLTLGLGVILLVVLPRRVLAGYVVKTWLSIFLQTERSIKRFWEPVLISALNDSLDRLDATLAQKVFRESFFQARDGFHLLVPRVPLGILFDEHVRDRFRDQNIEIRDSTNCTGIGIRNGVHELNLRSGEKLAARQIILATPWQVTSRLLSVSEIDALKAIAQRSASLVSSPITGIHLVFDRKVVPYTELALLDTTIQWVFDHTEADLSQHDSMVPDHGQSLHLVVSASHGLSALNRDEILAIAMQELKSAFPAVCHAKLLSSWVVTEHAATFSPQPGLERIRPNQATGIRGFAIAGDWTNTGWPSTMEGAIISGNLAARDVVVLGETT